MVDIVPALLVRSTGELKAGLERLRGVSPWVQVDLVGANYLAGEEYFPAWQEFNFEADLLLAGQRDAAEAMVALGAARIVVHPGSTAPGAGYGASAAEALQALQQYRVGDFKVEAGIALRAHDTPDVLGQFDGLYDYVQVMGIAHEGKQGEPHDPQALELIRGLRAAHPQLVIQVDGGVTIENARSLADAGASRLVAGSAIINADDPASAYKRLYTVVNGAQ